MSKDWITAIAERLVKEDNDKVERAYNETSKEFQQYIVVLENNERLFNNEQNLGPHHKDLGLFSYKNATYIKRRSPYMVVDGRVKMAVQACKEAGVDFELSRTEYIQMGDQVICQVCYKGVSSSGGSSQTWGAAEFLPQKPNPYRMAETAAIGRALGVAGFGVFGNGIESAEEMKQFISENDQTSGTYAAYNQEPSENQKPSQNKTQGNSTKGNASNGQKGRNQANPSNQTNNQSDKKYPVETKFVVNSPVEELQDGSYKFKGKTRDSNNNPMEVFVFVPNEASSILENAIPEEVMAIKGWLDEKRKIFRVAKKQ